MNLIKGSLLLFSVVCIFALSSCGNSNAESKHSNANSSLEPGTKIEKPNALPESNSLVKAELDKAKKEGKAAFVVVTGTGVNDADKATTIAQGANAIYKNAVVVQLNKDDASNAQLVTELRLSGAPLPLILVISSKGLPTGGRILSEATAENIAALIPSPKMEEVYAAISDSKPALVVFTKESLNDRKEVLNICKDAVSKLNNKAVIVQVDLDDSKELNFMNQLRIDKSSTASSTLVINAQGQVAGISTTVPNAEKLVLAATQPVKGGCGPGCGPAGCGK